MKHVLVKSASVAALMMLSTFCGNTIAEPVLYAAQAPSVNNAAAASNPVLSQFSTSFNAESAGRANNIKVASVAIDGKIIQPGETFSFNQAVGPTTKANGYMLSTVFVSGKESKGFGGGVCQVSSTLFNAAEMAGLKITERHPHSKEVHYVEKDRDAATSYGSSDLKFVNTLNHPVKIDSYINKDTITIEIHNAS